MAENQSRYGGVGGLLRRPVLALLPGGGIIRRELVASSGAIVALVALTVVVGWVGSMAIRGFDAYFFGNVWEIAAVVVALLFGVLCGAEERENGTADFTLRLPIPYWRIVLEKVCGSMLAFALWGLLSLGLGVFIGMLAGHSFWDLVMSFQGEFHKVPRTPHFLAWAALLYCFGMAAGAWCGKVVPGAIVAGVSAVVYTALAPRLLGRMDPGAGYAVLGAWTPPFIWLVCLAALCVTLARFKTLEGK